MTKTNFYNSLASSYDGMINFEEALKRRKEILSSMIQNKLRNLRVQSEHPKRSSM